MEQKTILKNIVVKEHSPDVLLVSLIFLFIVATFIIDLLTPMGYAVSILYLLPVVLTWWISSARYSLVLISVGTILVGLGGLYSPLGPQRLDVVNRLIGVGLLWAVGFLMFRVKRRERSLARSEVSFREVIDHAPVMIWGAAADGLCNYFNKPWLDFTGRSVELELGNGWSEGVHPDDLPQCLITYKEAVARREPFSMEYRLRRSDGEYRWIWDRGFPQFDVSRNYIGYIGSCADITDRKVAETVLLNLRDELEHEVAERTAQLENMVKVLQANVAERETTEKLLRSREERFHAFMDHLQGFSWIKDEQGRYVFANRYFINTFGLDPNAIIGKTDTELFSPEVAEAFRTNDRKVIESNRDLEVIETFFVNNEVRHGLANKFPLQYGDKERVLVGGLAIDITERIRKEQLLARQAQIIDQIHDAVITMDLEERVTSWNKGAERLFGYTSEEALGQHMCFLHPDDYHDLLRDEVIIPLKQNGNHSVELRVKGKNRERFFAHLALSVLRHAEGKMTGIIAYAKDITDRKVAEDALRNREADLELALNAAQMGTWNWHITSNEVNWCERAAGLFGVGSQRSSGTFDSYLSCVHPDDRRRVRECLQEALALGPTYEIEYRCVWQDGTVHWLVEKGKVLVNQNEQPVRVTGAVMDVTQRKEAESRLCLAHKQLRRLAKSLVEAEEEERGRLSRELHDEFAQILSGLAFGLARLGRQLQERFHADASADLEDDIRSMEALVNRMILSTRRIATGLRPSILDQLGLIASLHWLVRDFESRLKIPCQISISDEIAAQPFDSTLSITIFRITQELLTNVARHAQASRVVIDVITTAGQLILTVHDNGKGITEEDIYNSSSLGLRGIRERLALLGGEVEIHGLPGEGTSIQACIPNSLRSTSGEEGALH